MVIVLRERKLELTLTVRNYIVPQLQPVNLPRAVPKAPSMRMMRLNDRKWGQGSYRTGLSCRANLTISH